MMRNNCWTRPMLLSRIFPFLIYTGLFLLPNEVYGLVYIPTFDIYLTPYKIIFGTVILFSPFIGVNRGIAHFTTESILQLIFIELCFISVLVSQNPIRSFAITLWFPFYFLLGQTVSRYVKSRPETLRNLLAALYLAGVLYSLWGLAVLVAYFQGIDLGQYIGGDINRFLIVRLTSVTGEGNYFGLFLSLVLPIGIAFFLSSRSFSEYAANLIGVGILIIASILTFSRALWISIVAMLVMMLITHPARKRVISTLGLILGLGFITLMLVIGNDVLSPFFKQRVDDFANALYLSEQSHAKVWSVALEEWSWSLPRILFGMGQGNFGNWRKYGIYMEDLRGRVGLLHVHNLYVDALAANGIFAFGVLVAFLARELVLSWRLLRNKTLEADKCLLAAAPFYGLCGILVMGLSMNVLVTPHIWVAFALNELGRWLDGIE